MAGGSDILVIGGGIAGIGCAAMIGKRATVTVLEAEDRLGYHASARSAAIFLPAYGPATVRTLSAASEAYFVEPPAALCCDSLLSPRGELMVARADEDADMSAVLAAAPGLVEISVDEALARVPILDRGQVHRACLDAGGRDIDADRLLQAWSRHARASGACLHTAQRVTAIRRRGGRWQVHCGDDVHHASILVNAAGAWCDELASLAGIAPLGLSPHRRSAALLPAPAGHDVSAWPLFGSVNEHWYAKPLGGKLMVSPAEEDPVPPHDAFADDMVLAEGLFRYESAVTVPVKRVEHTWAGLRTFAPDRVPVAGFDPNEPGFFWLAGQGGYGIQTAPALSALAADLLLGEEPSLPAEPVAALSPRRLSRG